MTLRDQIGRYLPSWLGDNYPASPSNGFRVLYTLARFVDAGLSAAMQGSLAAVGRGTPTALKYVGQARGVTRGRFDTDVSYGLKLSTWVDRAKEAGNARRLATEIYEYLGDGPRVRVVNRQGHWVTVATDGTITETDAAWDWDSVSHPGRATWLSDQWVIVCPSWAFRDGTLGELPGYDGYALGHLATMQDVDVLKGVVQRYKSAHSCVRAVIWTSDATLFDPAAPLTCPDGTWGAWGIYSGVDYVPSGRDLTRCRFWEPR